MIGTSMSMQSSGEMVYPSITICKDLLTETFEDGNVDKPSISFPNAFDLNEYIVQIIMPGPDGPYEVDKYTSNLNNRNS